MQPNELKKDNNKVALTPTDEVTQSESLYRAPREQSLIPTSREINEQGQFMITYNHITYLLYVVSYFTAGLLWIVPIFMNYIKRGDAEGTWLATHFDWQIKTFWYSIVFFIIGIAIVVFSLGGLGIGVFAESTHIAAGSFGLFTIGLMILGLTVVWHLYRIIRGWIALADKRPVP